MVSFQTESMISNHKTYFSPGQVLHITDNTHLFHPSSVPFSQCQQCPWPKCSAQWAMSAMWSPKSGKWAKSCTAASASHQQVPLLKRTCWKTHLLCTSHLASHKMWQEKKITRIEQAAQVNPGNQFSLQLSFILEYWNMLSVIFILRVKEHPVIPSEGIMLLRINVMKRLWVSK